MALSIVVVLAAGGVMCAGAAAADTLAGSYIVVLQDGVASPAGAAADQARRYGLTRGAVFSSALKGYAAVVPAGELAALRADPAVRFVSPVSRFHTEPALRSATCSPAGGVNESSQCLPTGVDRIDSDVSSTRAGDGRGAVAGVNVAVLDTGIERHPDLNVAGGVDCSSGAPVSGPGAFADVFGHGTFVAGIIGAKDNGFGVVGVAPGVRLWSIHDVADETTGDASDVTVLCGINWATSTRTDANPRNDIAVVNMSEGAPRPSDEHCGLTDQDAVHLAICRSVAAGVTYVASAGNDAADLGEQIPASYPEVLAVTAMADFNGRPGGGAPAICRGEDLGAEFDIRDDRAAEVFSNFATRPVDAIHTISAPGVCVDSTDPLGANGYGAGAGTSFSAPHVAGTVALCLSTGACRGRTGVQVAAQVLAHAAAANLAHPAFGYVGDPLRPLAGRFYGFLIDAGAY
jgi:subtilisin family serine protease